MTEKSRAGLTLLAPDREVVVTCEEHQPALQVHAPTAEGHPRHVVVELGSPSGRPGVEIRLDGQRVGELSAPMSARYGQLIDDVLVHGGSPACIAQVVDGRRGLELTLRLPEVPVGGVVPPRSPVLVGAPEARGRQRTPYLVGAGVAALLIVVGLSLGPAGRPTVPAADAGAVVAATTTAAAPTPTVAAAVTTTRRAPAAPPPAHSAAPQPAPAITEAAPEPADDCDPNYDECVPVSDDVDCADDDGDGPAFVSGPVEVIGIDVYDLDPDDDGIACD